jgi:hypothetical protein
MEPWTNTFELEILMVAADLGKLFKTHFPRQDHKRRSLLFPEVHGEAGTHIGLGGNMQLELRRVFFDVLKNPGVRDDDTVGPDGFDGGDEAWQPLHILVVGKQVEGEVDLLSSGMSKGNAFLELFERKGRLGAQTQVRRSRIDRVGTVEDKRS